MSGPDAKPKHNVAEKSKGMADGCSHEHGRDVQPPNTALQDGPSIETQASGDDRQSCHQNQQIDPPNEQPSPLNEKNSPPNEKSSHQKKSSGPKSEPTRKHPARNGGSAVPSPKREVDKKGSESDTVRRDEKKMYEKQLEDLRIAYEKSVEEERARWIESTEAASSQLQSQLQSAVDEVARLQKIINKNEGVVTKAHEAMASLLSKNVSRALTDDKIKNELKGFYMDGLLNWCANTSTSKIPDSGWAKEILQSKGIINNSKGYLNEPANLQFPMDLPDGRSWLLLLQAALSQTLCKIFLQDAYFLAEGMDMSRIPGHDSSDRRRQLKELENLFYEVDKNAGVDWRVQMVESLEKAIPLDLRLVKNKAKAFVQDFQFLLKEVDEQAFKELVQLFVDFGCMTLKFWKIRTAIQVHGLPHFAEQKFEADPSIEAYGVTSPASRQRLKGRYIGVLLQPQIISVPLEQDGEVTKGIVWLKAAGWVSDSEGPFDTPR